jgi:AmiR/NasT family two-component response regulator
MNDTKNIRAVLKRAEDHLVARHHCSPQEARRRIYQRARAKKAELGHVARMIVADQAVHYHYNVPSSTCVS